MRMQVDFIGVLALHSTRLVALCYIYTHLVRMRVDFIGVLALHFARLVALCYNLHTLKFTFSFRVISLSLVSARF